MNLRLLPLLSGSSRTGSRNPISGRGDQPGRLKVALHSLPVRTALWTGSGALRSIRRPANAARSLDGGTSRHRGLPGMQRLRSSSPPDVEARAQQWVKELRGRRHIRRVLADAERDARDTVRSPLP